VNLSGVRFVFRSTAPRGHEQERGSIMKLRIATGLAAAVVALALAGCSSGGGSSTGSGYGAPPASESPSSSDSGASSASGAALGTASSSLGDIVVDGKGMTVYMYDNDTQGSGVSTCEGQCATNWPAVTTDSATPSVEGVTGEVGTITGVNGATQVTLNGWPLYYYAGDSAAGDTNGQGVGGIWWVLTPAGEKIGG
jgi:predicted lipoprotein with Yx(FWY)xxD motif